MRSWTGAMSCRELMIAKQYLSLQARTEFDLRSNRYVIYKTLTTLISSFCRESGVDSLQRHIENIHRKLAFQKKVDQVDVIICKRSLANLFARYASCLVYNDKTYD